MGVDPVGRPPYPARSLPPLQVLPSSSSSFPDLRAPSWSAAGGEPQASQDAVSGADGRPPRRGLRWVLEAVFLPRPPSQHAAHWS